MSKTTVYTSSLANGRSYAEKIADSYREKGYKVTVTKGPIHQWGSATKTETGYRIEVTKK